MMENLFILGQVLSFLKVGCRHDWQDLREVGQQVNVYWAAPDVTRMELPAIRHEPQRIHRQHPKWARKLINSSSFYFGCKADYSIYLSPEPSELIGSIQISSIQSGPESLSTAYLSIFGATSLCKKTI